MARYNDYYLLIFVSIWTIVQTIAHVWWVLIGRNLFSCSFYIDQQLYLYLYLTYFYTDDCGESPIRDYFERKTDRFPRNESYTDMDKKVYDFYLEGTFDGELFGHKSTMVATLMLLNLVVDTIWFITAVALLAGALLRMKEHSALVFYAPWILLDIIVLNLDLVGAVYFSLQIPKADVTRSSEVSPHLESFVIPNSAAMAIVSGRLGVVWLVNLYLIYPVSKVMRRAFKQRYSDERNSSSCKSTSAAERIRSWEQFYGQIQERTNQSSEEKSEISYCSTFKALEDRNENFCSTLNASPEEAVQNHLPWSYLPREDGKKHISIGQVKVVVNSNIAEGTSRF